MKKQFLSLLFVLAFFSVKAQEIEINETGSWYTLINKFKVSDKFYFSLVSQLRLVNFTQTAHIFIISPSVNYKISKSLTGSAVLDICI